MVAFCFAFLDGFLWNGLGFELHRRVTRPHGNSGVVKSKFRSNIPPHAFGASVRVVSLLASICFQLSLLTRCLNPPRYYQITDALPFDYLSPHPSAFPYFISILHIIICSVTGTSNTHHQVLFPSHIPTYFMSMCNYNCHVASRSRSVLQLYDML